MEHVIFISVNSMSSQLRGLKPSVRARLAVSALNARERSSERKKAEKARNKKLAANRARLARYAVLTRHRLESLYNKQMNAQVRANIRELKRLMMMRVPNNKKANFNFNNIPTLNAAVLKHRQSGEPYGIGHEFPPLRLNNAAINRVKAYYQRQAQIAAVNARIAHAEQMAANAERVAAASRAAANALRMTRRAKSAHPLFG